MGAQTRGGLLTAMLLAVLTAVVAGPAAAVTVNRGAVSLAAVHHDTSPPLRSIPPASPSVFGPRVVPLRPLPRRTAPAGPRSAQTGAVQERFGAQAAPATLLNFDGVGNGFTGPAGSFIVNSAPPDPNLAVGPNHIVDLVNTDFAVFDKSGTAIFGPVATNTLWSGFGGGCETNNDGDGDGLLRPDRRPLGDSAVLRFVDAVPRLRRRLPDARSDWRLVPVRVLVRELRLPRLPEAGGVARRVLHQLQHLRRRRTHSTARASARSTAPQMLAGAAATQQCFNTSTSYGGVLPSDSRWREAASVRLAELRRRARRDGEQHDRLLEVPRRLDDLGELDVHRTDRRLRSAPTTKPAPAAVCIPQSGTTQQLDSLAIALMYRLAYRNFGDHESLVVNHSVVAGSSAGIRWYELRPDAGHNRRVFQQGTYAPDSNFRWMGSIAEDQVGDMGLGFSVSELVDPPGDPLHRAPGRRRGGHDDRRGKARSSTAPDRRPASPQSLGRLQRNGRRPVG